MFSGLASVINILFTTVIKKRNTQGGNIMNGKNETTDSRNILERIRRLEQKITELEEKLAQSSTVLLEEELRARGLG